jgi:hypothetical protein
MGNPQDAPSESMTILSNYRVGLNNVGSYQVSGIPFISGSSALAHSDEVKFGFPSVAKSVTVINKSSNATIRVHYNSINPALANGSADVIEGNHFVPLANNGDSITLNIKCKEIYISTPSTNASNNADFRVIAELTQIPTDRMFSITGSGLTTSPT